MASFFAGLHERAPAIRRDALDQRRLDMRARLSACAKPREARVNDARVIDDQRIAGREKLRQVADGTVHERAICRDDEQTRAVARIGGTQRDRLLRQLEIEEIDAHGVF